jgi:hypothetical protein
MNENDFGDREVVNVDFWQPRELHGLLHRAATHRDRDAALTLESINQLMESRKDRRSQQACLCCDAVIPRNSRTYRVVLAWGARKSTESADYVRSEQDTCCMMVCGKCTDLGPDWVQDKALAAMWKVWPRALAIRIRHDISVSERTSP